MTNKHPRKPSISASSLGQVRKIYMSKMTEQGCSRTLKDKCRDIWDQVIDDAVEADAECSGMMYSYGYGKELEPVYIPDKPNGIQKKENGKKAHTEGSTESETESEEESNSETEVEIDPSLDGSECECRSGCACACACCRVEYPESLVESGGGSEAESLLSCGLDGGEGDDE
ncbi:hypothetical protein ABZX51_003432 [Aspergillus tubingensis]